MGDSYEQGIEKRKLSGWFDSGGYVICEFVDGLVKVIPDDH